MTLGWFSIDVGGMRAKVGRLWVPDGLHVWVRSRGIHIYWSRSDHQRRVVLDHDPWWRREA